MGESAERPIRAPIASEDSVATSGLSVELAVTVVDLAPDGILVVDEQGRIGFANRQVGSIFGRDPDALIGESVESLIPERYREPHLAHRAGFAATSASRPMGLGLDLWGLHADGSEVPVQVSLSPVNAASGVRTIVMVREVSQHQAIEHARRTELLAADQDRIAAELHESVIQHLFRSGMVIQSAITLASDPVTERLREAVGLLDVAIRQVRDAVFDRYSTTHPPAEPSHEPGGPV